MNRQVMVKVFHSKIVKGKHIVQFTDDLVLCFNLFSNKNTLFKVI